MITKTLTSAFILFILLIIYFANTGTMPTVFMAIQNFPYGDKVAHFVLMGTLSFLVNLALHGRTHTLSSRPFLLGSFAVALIVLLEELSQIFLPNRTFSLADLTADFLGIFLFGRLATHVLRYQKHHTSP